MATVIASQALISGAFSLTVQAIQLDYLPRLKILQTSSHHRGQVYVPLVNWLLMIGCVLLVIGFQSSSNLAAAYGIAVTTTMAITSVLFFVIARDRWGWSTLKAVAVVAPLLLIDLAFLGANIPKIPDGGWLPLLVAVLLLVQMATWRRGRQLVAARIRRAERTVPALLAEHPEAVRIDGTAVFLFKDPGWAPPALVNNLIHNKVLHADTILVAIDTSDAPYLRAGHQRSTVEPIGAGVHQVELHFGYMEPLNIPAALAAVQVDGRPIDLEHASYFVGHESVQQGDLAGMHPVLEHLYTLLHRGAASATRFFNLPAERVFEVGAQVEI
jgi:KUP system potassium uptake protein